MSLAPPPRDVHEWLDQVEQFWLVGHRQRTHSTLCWRWHERCVIQRLVDLARKVQDPEACDDTDH